MKTIIQNKSAARNEEHPFHILPPSYLPFVVALLIGVFVGTFAMLMHVDSIKESVPFFSLVLPGNPAHYSYYRLLVSFLCLVVVILV